MITHLVLLCPGCYKAPYKHASIIKVSDPHIREPLYKATSFKDACNYMHNFNEVAWVAFKIANPDAVRGDI